MLQRTLKKFIYISVVLYAHVLIPSILTHTPIKTSHGLVNGIKIYKKRNTAHTQCAISTQTGGTCSGYNPDPDDNENKERKFNTIFKSEFFKKVKNEYEHYRDGIYKRKRGSKGIENAEYIEWDHLHNDVEAYGKNERHIGSIDPKTLKIYKAAVRYRQFPID